MPRAYKYADLILIYTSLYYTYFWRVYSDAYIFWRIFIHHVDIDKDAHSCISAYVYIHADRPNLKSYVDA